MTLSTILEEEILPRVQKPSRYLGTELNTVHKKADEVDVRIVLAFPDLYDLGLGNLGLHILYAIVNALPWAWCERVYSPALDMEEELRKRDLPLFALESRDPIDHFDGLGITLQTELTYTNILNLLDLSNIPLRTEDRDDSHPLVFGGGPTVFNPEPIAPFIDFFLIGDGEEAMVEIAEVFRAMKGRSRFDKLVEMAKLDGVYVPALYPFEVLEDGSVLPVRGAPKIRKRLTRDLDGATFPTDYIVPFTKQVHDRISLEVLRGCTQGCRFCQAGMVTRPVRERKIDKIEDLMRRTLENTGYEEVSLVSLSTCDYSQVQSMVNRAVETANESRASVSLPSLRLDSFSVGLADLVAETRRSGITFAPEAASPRMRAVINKFIPDQELLDMSAGAFRLGWNTVKLYFMIGLPTERDEDVEAIADLAIRTMEQGRGIQKKARVNLGVSTFVPKPFTPFQWAAQIGINETHRKQNILKRELWDSRGIKFGRHDPRDTFIEGLVSRSDRRAADLIEAAWNNGARFDAWGEHMNFDAWQKAIDDTNFDVDAALGERRRDQRLPWDHLDVLVEKSWLLEDWERATLLQWAPDCRAKKCHQCGVIDEERDLCRSMLKDNNLGRRADANFVKPERTEHVEPEPAQRLWFRYARTESARFLGHLEANSAWLRTFRRARVPLAFTRGFNPHPKVAFSDAVPTGAETIGDYIDVTLAERVDPIELLDRIRRTLPAHFDLLGVREVSLRAPALMGIIESAAYTIYFPNAERLDLATRVHNLRNQQAIPYTRTIKKKGRRVEATLDMKPFLLDIHLTPNTDVPAVDIHFVSQDRKMARPRDIIPFLTDDPSSARPVKRDVFFRNEDGELVSLATAIPTGAKCLGLPDGSKAFGQLPSPLHVVEGGVSSDSTLE